MMGSDIQTEVIVVSLPKKFPSREKQMIQFGPKLLNLLFHYSSSVYFLEILWHDGAQYIDKSNSKFFRKNLQPQRFLETFQHNGVQQLDISNISQFSNKIPFSSKGQFWQKLCNLILMICSLRVFLNLCSMMGYKRPNQCWPAFPRNLILMERATRVQFGPQLCSPL